MIECINGHDSSRRIVLKKVNDEPVDEKIVDVRTLSPDNFGEILELQLRALRDLPDKTVCTPAVEADLISYHKDGIILGVYDGDNLIAYSAISFPGDTDENYAKILSFSQKELFQVAQLEYTLVDPAYRGNDIQKFCINLTKQIAAEKGAKFIFVRTDPINNPHSLNNIKQCGFQELYCTRIHDGYQRVILYLPV